MSNHFDVEDPRNVYVAPINGDKSAPRRGRSRRQHEPDAQEQIRVLGLLRETIELHHEALDDPDIMIILAEGETDLMQALDCMVDADICDDALIQGLKVAKDTMAARLHRFEERKKSRRVIIEQALMLLQCNSLQRPAATLSLTERPPSLVVEEEAQVPAQFFDMKPVLNRTRAKAALEAGEVIAGARLSSGSITVTVRRR